jgi:hypothetical protein
MKSAIHTLKALLLAGVVLNVGTPRAMAQDDGIYDDIYQPPTYQETTTNPLDGYSTYDQDDYYEPQNQRPTQSEQYVDENGNTYITNNYYGMDDYDYFYASRINRFHRPIHGFGFYDPFYTNMYWYNYDPFFFGTSIYAGWGWGGFYRPMWGWGGGWGWNSWGMGMGWNSWGMGMGWNSWGMGWGGGWGWNSWNMGWGGGGWGMGGYGMGYNHGYWNGFYDGLAMGNTGYFNTFDQNSGIYYGHRGGTAGMGGSGLRSTSFAERYNRAAAEGQVLHANRGNILRTDDGRSVQGRQNIDGFRSESRSNDMRLGNTNPNVRSEDGRTAISRPEAGRTETGATGVGREQIGRTGADRNASSSPSRTEGVRDASSTSGPQRVPSTRDRDAIRQEGGNVGPRDVQTQPQRAPQTQPQRAPQTQPQRAPQTQPQRAPQTQPQRAPQVQPRTPGVYNQRTPQPVPQRQQPTNIDRSRPMYQAPARPQQQPQRDVYQRGSAPRTQPPAYRQPSQPQRSPQAQPQRQQPSRNMAPTSPQQRPSAAPSRQAPSRNVAPSRQAPSRNMAPSRPSSPSPSRGVSPSSPSRGGSFSAPSRGGGGMSSPSRGGGSMGGRRGG